MRGMYNLDSNTKLFYHIRKGWKMGNGRPWVGGGGYAFNGVSALTDISVNFWGSFGQLYLFLGWGVSNVAG